MISPAGVETVRSFTFPSTVPYTTNTVRKIDIWPLTNVCLPNASTPFGPRASPKRTGLYSRNWKITAFLPRSTASSVRPSGFEGSASVSSSCSCRYGLLFLHPSFQRNKIADNATGIPHQSTADDIHSDGYMIPKGSILIPSIMYVSIQILDSKTRKKVILNCGCSQRNVTRSNSVQRSRDIQSISVSRSTGRKKPLLIRLWFRKTVCFLSLLNREFKLIFQKSICPGTVHVQNLPLLAS